VFELKIAKSWEAKYIERKPPYTRTLAVLMAPDTHGVKNLAINMVVVPPKGKSDVHSHPECEEYWIIVDGRGEMIIDGEKTSVEPGVIVYSPPNASHQMVNTGYEPLKAYFLFAPPGPEKKLLEDIKKEE